MIEYFKGADAFPVMWQPAVTALVDAIREEERAYRRRCRSKAVRKDFPWRSLPCALTVTGYGWVDIHWSAEHGVGPRDYDRDVVRRTEDIREAFLSRMGGYVEEAHVFSSELSCGLMQVSFLPVMVS